MVGLICFSAINQLDNRVLLRHKYQAFFEAMGNKFYHLYSALGKYPILQDAPVLTFLWASKASW